MFNSSLISKFQISDYPKRLPMPLANPLAAFPTALAALPTALVVALWALLTPLPTALPAFATPLPTALPAFATPLPIALPAAEILSQCFIPNDIADNPNPIPPTIGAAGPVNGATAVNRPPAAEVALSATPL